MAQPAAIGPRLEASTAASCSPPSNNDEASWRAIFLASSGCSSTPSLLGLVGGAGCAGREEEQVSRKRGPAARGGEEAAKASRVRRRRRGTGDEAADPKARWRGRGARDKFGG